jgi:hypothetical protein
MIKDSVRPDYWAKDSENQHCFICEFKFGDNEELNPSDLNQRESSSSGSSQESPVHKVVDGKIHHCRSCGQAVCNKCSLNRKAVRRLGDFGEGFSCPKELPADPKELPAVLRSFQLS